MKKGILLLLAAVIIAVSAAVLIQPQTMSPVETHQGEQVFEAQDSKGNHYFVKGANTCSASTGECADTGTLLPLFKVLQGICYQVDHDGLRAGEVPCPFLQPTPTYQPPAYSPAPLSP